MLVYEKKIKKLDSAGNWIEVPTLAVSYTNLPNYDQTDVGVLDPVEQGIFSKDYLATSDSPSGWNLGAGGGSGTSDYNSLSNKPQINGITLQGNVTNLYRAGDSTVTVSGNLISGNYQAGNNITIAGNVISGSVTVGSEITVTRAVGGYAVGDVIASGTSLDAVLTKMLTGTVTTYNIVGAVTPTGSGTVTGGGSYVAGSTAVLNAVANTGYKFKQWQEDGSTATQKVIANVSADATWTAEFEVDGHTITCVASPTAGGTVSTNVTSAAQGDTITITNTPATGYEVDTISVVGASGAVAVSGNTFVMPNEDVTVTTTFKQKDYAITLTSDPLNEGTWVKPTGTLTQFHYGDTVTAKIDFSASTLTFKNITCSDSSVVLNPTATTGEVSFTMPANDITLTANFAAATVYSYTFVAGANGSISTAGGNEEAGKTVNFVTAPNSGYEVDTITITGGATATKDSDNHYHFTMPAANTTVTVTFKGSASTITTAVDPTGAGTVAGGGAYTTGDLCTLQATANSGYTFDHWNNGSVSQVANPYTFNVAGDETWTAYFNAVPTYATTVTTSGPTGAGTASASPSTGASQGATVTLTAVPNSGYQVKEWTVTSGGVTLSATTGNTVTFTMGTSNVEINCEFEAVTSQLSYEDAFIQGARSTPAADLLPPTETNLTLGTSTSVTAADLATWKASGKTMTFGATGRTYTLPTFIYPVDSTLGVVTSIKQSGIEAIGDWTLGTVTIGGVTYNYCTKGSYLNTGTATYVFAW